MMLFSQEKFERHILESLLAKLNKLEKEMISEQGRSDLIRRKITAGTNLAHRQALFHFKCEPGRAE